MTKVQLISNFGQHVYMGKQIWNILEGLMELHLNWNV